MRLLFSLAVLGVACGGAHKVNLDETTAEGHRREAEKESVAARGDLDRHERSAKTPEGEASRASRGAFSPTGEYTYPLQSYDPAHIRLEEAAKHSAHARAHEAAARALEHFEEAECKEFPPETRAACPVLGPAVGYKEIERGVTVTFQAGVPVAAVAAHMRCHLAYARARGYSEDCPLYMKGVRIAVTPDGKGVTVTTDEAGDVAELRRRARLQIVIGKPPTTL